jgi:HSP20 family protein
LAPRLDVTEEKGKLVVKGEFPGVKKEDIDITLEGDTLKLVAEKKEETVSEEATHHYKERRFGRYSRTMRLPIAVDGDKVTATYDDGLLTLRLPKAVEAEQKETKVKVRKARAKKPKAIAEEAK